MQASLPRWAAVTFCLLGSVGCQGTKPGWWPGHKGPVYSQSSTTPPAAVTQQYQQPGQGQQYPQQAPTYMDQAGQAAGSQGTATSYQSGAGGYPIGSANPQDPYGMAGTQPAPGANPYEQGYGQQQHRWSGPTPNSIPQAPLPIIR